MKRHPTPKTAGQPFVAYYRVSTEDQRPRSATDSPAKADRYGLAMQKADVHRYLASVKGKLAAEFSEIESGRARTRPIWQLAEARAKELGAIVIIAKLDRLARDVGFLMRLMDSGLEFLALDLPGANRFTLTIMMAVAEQEATRASERTKAGMRMAKAAGKVIGAAGHQNLINHGAAAKGAARSHELAIVHYRAQHADAMIDAWRSAKRPWSYQRIADEFNARKVKTRYGGRWHPSTVLKVERLMARARAAKDVA